VLIGQTSNVLEFVVADRNADGTAEKIRYEWSGTSGHPLRKTVNGGTPVTVLELVTAFSATPQLKTRTESLKTTVDSAELILASNASVVSGSDRDITVLEHSAQQINPAAFASIPANAISWNATKIDFHGRQEGGTTETLLVQLRPAADPYNAPTSHVFGQVSIPESMLTGSYNWNTAVFPSPIRNLVFHRMYAIVWAGIGSGKACRFRPNNDASSGVFESSDAGASWQWMAEQMFWRLYGTYTTPGTTYNVNRNVATHVQLKLQSGGQSFARLDASVPLVNAPEVLASYWRTDFDRNPTTTNGNGDAVADWVLAGGGSFDTATLISGVWYANGALETRPLHDFTQTTIVEVRCRNASVGGNGAVVRINADRQGGLYAPLLVYLQRQADGTQTLSLNGKTSDAATSQLFTRSRLSGEFVRVRLIIVPQYDVVNLAINDEDQGTYTYPTYAPSNSTDRFFTFFGDTSQAEFDYVDLRVAN
jgi:hypothetical protein